MIAGIVIMLIIIVSVSVLWVHTLSRTADNDEQDRQWEADREEEDREQEEYLR